MTMRKTVAALLLMMAGSLAACGPVPHPFAEHKESNPLVEDRRVTSSIQIVPMAEYPGLAEAIVRELARQDILATSHDAGPRKVLVKGAVENGALVWRAATADNAELGAAKQLLPLDHDVPVIAREAAPVIVGLLTASGAAPDANRPRITVHAVRGPKGMRTEALAQALAEALISRGVAIGSDNAIAVVDGEARVLPETGTEDVLQIDWTVRDTKGAVLGTISQGSPVDHKLLTGPMTNLAHDIATAGAPGIVDVLRRKLPSALGGSPRS